MRRWLHRDLENELSKEENEERPDDKKVKSQAAGYLGMVSGKFKIPFRVCEASMFLEGNAEVQDL